MHLKQTEIPSTLSLKNIEAASQIIDPVFLNTPQFLSEPLSELTATQVILKVETINPIRSFKGRGAELFISSVAAGTRLICASAGNFGQAIAYAARKRNLPVTIFAAETANPLKVERMRKLGAEVFLHGQDFDTAKQRAVSFAQEQGACFLEDGREPAISEGAGTIAVELCRWPSALDCVLVPLGNGALLAGMGAWLKAKSPKTRVIGVCAAGAPSMALSWRERKPHPTDSVSTIADGIAVRVPVPEAVAELDRLVDEIVLVDDDKIIEAMQLLFRHHGLLTEPAGAAGLAALLNEKDRFRGMTIATPLCGANITSEQFRRWLQPAL